MARQAFIFILFVNAAATAQAVQFGWQELQGGGIEYIVQVEPELLDSFHEHGFVSDLPSTLRDVRSVRITVGKETLPNQNDLRGPEPKSPSPGAASSPKQNQQIGGNAGGGQENINQASIPAAQSSTKADADAKSPTADQQGLPPMPFLGLGKSAGTNSSPPGGPDKLVDPQLKPEEGPRGGAPADAANNHVVDKPAISSSANATNGSSEAATPKPWWALMGALLALFASLGANVYLVWIHQEARAKYRALVQRSPAGAM